MLKRRNSKEGIAYVAPATQAGNVFDRRIDVEQSSNVKFALGDVPMVVAEETRHNSNPRLHVLETKKCQSKPASFHMIND